MFQIMYLDSTTGLKALLGKITAGPYLIRVCIFLLGILREMLPHARYAKWWKKTVPSHQDFAKNIVQSGGSPKSPHSAPHVSKANTNGNDADFPPGFLPKPVSTYILLEHRHWYQFFPYLSNHLDKNFQK